MSAPIIPSVPAQLKNANSGWFVRCYEYLVALVAVLIAFTAGGRGNQIVYRQGAVTNAAAGIFGDFPSAFKVWVTIPNGNMVIDGTLAQPFVPAGRYPLPAACLWMTAYCLEVLNLEEGAVFAWQSGTTLRYVDITINNQATATIPNQVTAHGFGFNQSFAYSDSAVFQTDAMARVAMYECSSGDFDFIAYNESAFTGTAEAPIFAQVVGAAEIELDCIFTVVNDYVFGGALGEEPGCYLICDDGTCTVSLNQGAGLIIQYGAGAFTNTQNESGTVAARVTANNVSAQSIPSATATVVTGWTAVTNLSPLTNEEGGGSFVPSTGIFTCPFIGRYQVTGRIAITPGTGVFKLSLMQNATVMDQDLVVTASTPSQPIVLKVALGIQCNAGDTISLQATQTSGGPLALNATAALNTFSISFGA